MALVFLPHLKGSFLQGVTFLDGNKIVVGLTAGVRDADRSWSSFFHELAHILLGHIGQMAGTSDQDEDDADRWSEDILIPPADLEQLKEEGDFSSERICRFAHEQEIAPGIVVGRLQREGAIGQGVLDELKERYG